MRTSMPLQIAALILLLASLMGCPPPFTPDPDPNPTQRLFQAQLRYPAGDQPFAVVTADLNGDGLPDVITPNEESDAVSVLLRRAAGSFAAQQEYAAGGGPVAAAVGLLDADAALDIVAANSTSGDVSVFLGVGDGAFGAETRLPLAEGAGPLDVAVGDTNGDGFLDIVIANSGLANVSVLPGAGDGTFAAPVDLAVGAGPRAVVVEDLNGDGRVDILTANRDSNDVSLLLSHAAGYDPAVSLAVGANPRSVALADLDGDGVLDIVASSPGSNDFSVLRGLGAGAFAPQTRVVIDYLPTRFVVADFNGDHRPDLAAVLYGTGAASMPLAKIAVLLGDGAGGFGAPRYFGSRGQTIGLAAADINADNRADLVTANSATDDISVLHGRGNGTFETDERFTVGALPRMAVAADFNRDSRVDLAVANLNSGDITLLLGRGDGTFQRGTTVNVTGTPRALALGALDGDAYTDLVAVDFDGGYVSVFPGRGDGTFAAERRLLAGGLGSRPRSVAIGDLNKDGIPDLVVENSRSDNVSVLLGIGNGFFGLPAHFNAGNFPLDVHVTDLDGDSFPDVVLVNGIDPDDPAPNQQPRVRTLFGVGDGTLEARVNFGPYSVDPDPRALAIGDLNGSGGMDGVTVHPGRKSANVLQGKTDGKFIAGEPSRTGDAPNSVVIGDVDNDRRNDILTTNDSDSVSLLLNRGSLVFASPLVYPVGSRPIGGLLVDVNNDGRADVVLVNRDTDDISVLLAVR
ncbi:MAG TPA: VCBS repeat-containing protein [Candidatus Hydrogenedentes bacterium]|nr:VCBS repeat-containing protein [Candidatus Hydrogenedentota bacterium]